MIVILIVAVCLLITGFTYRSMLTIKGYEKFDDIPKDHDDQPTIIIGSILWPVTALLYAGIKISKSMMKGK